MNKLAFYGYIEFFDTFEDREYVDSLENDVLISSMINGCYANFEFNKRCFKLKYTEEHKDIMNGIMISRNDSESEYYNSEKLFYDFNYPFIRYALLGVHRSDLIYLSIIFDWRYVYEDYMVKYGDLTCYSLALYVGNEYYIKDLHKRCKDSYNSYEHDDRFFRHLNTNNLRIMSNKFPKYSQFDDIPDYIEESDFIDIATNVDTSNVTNYDIVNNFDLAYKLYKEGNTCNIVLSKIICMNPTKFENLFKKYKPFIIFTRNQFDTRCMSRYSEIEPRVKYNILYNNIISLTIHGSTKTIESDIDIPEYNLYVLSVKMRQHNLVHKILELYKKEGYLIKIMDLDNEKYIDPPLLIKELPIVKNIDLIKGDELNPYA
ncbi:hypothetical protein KGF56_000165 [Candida oxycetoniae]|uniref:Uncharacterized protein n=1 Tax=Candida oxycetoniae TaxID=497107 RepID=A0AAI9T147_9ASCO|nr:uncharacterized protein KGF56_000165 [Candida oxycetoniae]KAI3406873.1 hypothetical protein KGF56_000165 [Candida oxycetoniae]